MICTRCSAPIAERDGCMRLSGGPLGRTGPRLTPSVICKDCCRQLQMFMAGPLPLPADDVLELPPIPVVSSAEA